MGHANRSALTLGAVIGLLTGLAGCARTVHQHAHTGKDGTYKGALKLALDGETAKASGIVTYPGGDRVDWKLIQLPEGATGTLEIELKWKTPRPGLDLAFDVYTTWGDKIGGVDAKGASAARSPRKTRFSKKATVKGATDAVYVEVYASQRGDAGKYDLAVTFTSDKPMQATGFDELLQKLLASKALVIPDPPRLSTVYPTCTVWDDTNLDCHEAPPRCTAANYHKANPSCDGVCDPDNPKDKKCHPACDPKNIDKANPNCTDVEPPVVVVVVPPEAGKVISGDLKNGKTHITIAIAKDSPVKTGWTGYLEDSRGNKVSGSEFKVYKVRDRQAFGALDLSVDTVNANRAVVLEPPAP